jgi:hypothetical protein
MTAWKYALAVLLFASIPLRGSVHADHMAHGCCLCKCGVNDSDWNCVHYCDLDKVKGNYVPMTKKELAACIKKCRKATRHQERPRSVASTDGAMNSRHTARE